jgi:hypothetical protein
MLDAHCECGHCGDGTCKTDRTLDGIKPDSAKKCQPKKRVSLSRRKAAGQGRPLGRQLLWLELGLSCDAAQHKTLRKTVGSATYYERRKACRAAFCAKFSENPVAKAILEAERPKRDEESDAEPRFIP